MNGRSSRRKGNSTRRCTWTLEERGYETPCWIWQGRARGNAGYPVTSRGGKTMHAHRAIYFDLVGSIAPGLHLDHLCRVPLCVNPEHMEPVTSHENTLRGNATKLSADDVAEIRLLHDRLMVGRNKRVPVGWRPLIATAYGVCDGTIRCIWNGSKR